MKKIVRYILIILLLLQFGCGSSEKRLIVSFNFAPSKTPQVGDPTTFQGKLLSSNAGPIQNYYWEVIVGDTGVNPRSATTPEFTTTFMKEEKITIRLTIDFGGPETSRYLDKDYDVIIEPFFVDIQSPHDQEPFILGMDSAGNPSMPSTLICKGIVWNKSGSDLSKSAIDYKWSIETNYNPGTGGVFIEEIIASTILNYEALYNGWKPNFTKIGGDLKITLQGSTKTETYKSPTVTNTVIIIGIDPPKDKLLAYIGDTLSSISPLPKLYKAICYEETGWNMKQFSFGRPYISSIGGRIGLMGIRKTYYLFEWGTVEGINKIIIKDGVIGSGQNIEISNEDIWNWQKNIDKGKEIYEKKLRQAKITHTFYQYKSSPQFPPALTDIAPDYQLTKEALSLYYNSESYWIWNGTSWVKNTSNIRGTDYADTVVNFALNPPFSEPPW